MKSIQSNTLCTYVIVRFNVIAGSKFIVAGLLL